MVTFFSSKIFNLSIQYNGDKMNKQQKIFKSVDKVLLIISIFLLIIGLLMVYSASNIVASYRYDDKAYFIKKQALYAFIGLIIAYLMIKIDLEKLKKHTTLVFCCCLSLLIIVLIPGIGIVRGGARSWLGIGNFTIQPSELMKLGIIFLLARFLEKASIELAKFKNFLIVLVLIIFVFALIMLQPDFGTGIVIVISSVLLLFTSNANIKYFLFLLFFGVIGIIGLIIVAPYRVERIMAFLDPWTDPLGSGFQGIQALFAIAPSGIFGLGYNNSMQKHFFLPEPQNDFIFAIICEELGLIGGLVVIILFFLIIKKSVTYALKTEDPYLKYLSLGLGLSLFTQVFINIGVVIGLIPVTGITLPIISYGGTSLIISLIQLGILLNISRRIEK